MNKGRVCLALAILAASMLACDLPFLTPPTPSALPPTVTPHTAPPTPTPEPPTDWLPPGTIALYAAGAWENPSLHALAADGSATELDRVVYTWPDPTTSPSGRWIAYPGGPPQADTIVAANLEDGTTHTIQATPDFTFSGAAFGAAETHLALLEVGPPTGEDTAWAIVVVSLDDGSTTRFEARMGPDHAYLPGSPIGWSASGELLIDTFLPYSEGGFAGVWGLSLPPGTASAPLDTLSRRELLSNWSYLSDPRLAPDATQFLYLARDPDYTPADYTPIMLDLATNQLQVLDLASGASTRLLQVTDGGALGSDVAWSPDGAEILFTHGRYAQDRFASLTLKIRDEPGNVHEVGPLPPPPDSWAGNLNWCTPDVALYTTKAEDHTRQLYLVNLTSGEITLVASADYVSVLGCVSVTP
jgi:hypothetical protein